MKGQQNEWHKKFEEIYLKYNPRKKYKISSFNILILLGLNKIKMKWMMIAINI